jgi:hypothetical protein
MLTMDNVLYAQPTYPNRNLDYDALILHIKYQESISYSEELKIIIDKTIDKFYKHNFSLTKRNKDEEFKK